jgi:hypothetical protein
VVAVTAPNGTGQDRGRTLDCSALTPDETHHAPSHRKAGSERVRMEAWQGRFILDSWSFGHHVELDKGGLLMEAIWAKGVGGTHQPSARNEARASGAYALLLRSWQVSSQCSEMGHSPRPVASPSPGCPLGTPPLHLLVRREGGGCALRRPQGLFACRPRTPTRKKSQGIHGSVGRCALRCSQMAKVERGETVRKGSDE